MAKQQEVQLDSILSSFEIEAFQEDLLYWFERQQRVLPWRENRDAYRVWVSEIMLQQTRVETVIPYYERFMARFPTLKDLAEADLEEVYKLWEGLGYYSRARNLHSAVREVQESYGGTVPNTPEDVYKLKGIGPYTAGAILSIAYGLPEPAVDGNVMRVLSRILYIEDDIAKAKTRKLFEAVIRRIIAFHNPSFFNQALMELGALICVPRSPRCHECPVMQHCRARETGNPEKLPIKTKAKQVRVQEMAVGLVQLPDDKWLLHKRPETGLLANLWEFPNIEIADGIKAGEGLSNAAIEQLSRYLYETDGVRAIPYEKVMQHTHVFSHLQWNLHVYVCKFAGSAEKVREQVEQKRAVWVSLDDMENYPFSVSHKKIAEALSKGFQTSLF
ncbi:A/G-specific adenine glycosylase [Aneurinibacillus terranovensis]|uniref:A/G-specific adenine glycosylase n=1 Tax=Aneurinibacillus terranovensis TaxID=278991 RepID=UPI00041FE8BF|nr:A/G-specific adenine glycosylase [Aneurinibacillus terranovensis]